MGISFGKWIISRNRFAEWMISTFICLGKTWFVREMNLVGQKSAFIINAFLQLGENISIFVSYFGIIFFKYGKMLYLRRQMLILGGINY